MLMGETVTQIDTVGVLREEDDTPTGKLHACNLCQIDTRFGHGSQLSSSGCDDAGREASHDRTRLEAL